MFCTKCGSQCADNATFCTTCGASLNAAPAQPVYTEPVQQPVYTQPVQQPAYEQTTQSQYQQPVYEQPAQPQYQQPVYTQPAKPVAQIAPATAYQKKMALILAILAAFSLVIGFMHTFCLVDLPTSINVEVDASDLGLGGMAYDYDDYDDYIDYTGGVSTSSMLGGLEIDGSVGNIYVSPSVLSEAFDLLDTASRGVLDASFSMGYVGLIVFGVLNLAIAGIGILFYLRARSNNGLYDSICGSFIKGKTPAAFIGIVGVAACLIEIVCMWFTGFDYSLMDQSVGMSVGVHWITWIALIAYGTLAASQLLAIDKPEE